jgi:hypothetical protein
MQTDRNVLDREQGNAEVSIPIVSGETHRLGRAQLHPVSESADISDSGSSGSYFNELTESPVVTLPQMHGMHESHDMQSSRVSGDQQMRRRRAGMEGSEAVEGAADKLHRLESDRVGSFRQVGHVHPDSPSDGALLQNSTCPLPAAWQ